jgi:hypothetical protein
LARLKDRPASFVALRVHQDAFSFSLFFDETRVFPATSSTQVAMMALGKALY